MLINEHELERVLEKVMRRILQRWLSEQVTSSAEIRQTALPDLQQPVAGQ